MFEQMLRNGLVAAALALAAALSPWAAAKPPDLPADSRDAVAPLAGARQVDIPEEREPKPVLPLQAEQIPVMPVERKPIDPKLAGASRLYRIGERCRREGDLDMAVNCYHETHLLSPHSTYGRKAQQRLTEIRERRAVEPPSPAEASQEPPRRMPQRRSQSPKVLFVPPPPRDLTIQVEEPHR